MHSQGSRVVVVGAGSIGATIAYELAHAGMEVTLVDAGTEPGAGCSFANAGLLSPAHVESMATPTNIRLGLRYMWSTRSPFRLSPRPSLLPWLFSYVVASRPRRAAAMTALLRSMATRSLALHHDYVGRGIATSCRRTGSLDVYNSQRKWDDVRAAAPEASLATPSQIEELAPGLVGAVGGVVHEEDATCNTLDYVTSMVAAAQEQGAEVLWGRSVETISTAARRIDEVTLSDGIVLRPDHVVVAAGMGTPALCRQVGVSIPLESATGYVIDVPSPARPPKRPITVKESKVVITPFESMLRVAGTLDLSGRPGEFKAARLEAVREAASRALPHVDWSAATNTWSGDRPTTSDGVPVIGASGTVNGLVVASGHGMWGLVLAPITAERVLRGLTTEPSALRNPALSPDRFGSGRRHLRERWRRRRQAWSTAGLTTHSGPAHA